MTDRQFKFEIKGSVPLVCVGGCGRPPRYVIVAIEVGDQVDVKDFPRVATCGECKVSTPGSSPAEDLEDAVRRGRRLGESLAESVMSIIDIFGGRRREEKS